MTRSLFSSWLMCATFAFSGALVACNDCYEADLPPVVAERLTFLQGESMEISICPSFARSQKVSELPIEINEASGMVASRQHPDLFWIHNDSGDSPSVYGVNMFTGELVTTVTLEGVRARDWEAIAIGDCGDGRECIYIGDIGDNLAKHASVRIIRFPEPGIKCPNRTVSNAEVMVANYSDVEAIDAESMFVTGEDVWILSKEPNTFRVYKAPFVEGAEPQTLQLQGTINFQEATDFTAVATAADIHPTLPRILVRGYGVLIEYVGKEGDTPFQILQGEHRRVATGFEFQSEAVSYIPGGFVHTAEANKAPIYVGMCSDYVPPTPEPPSDEEEPPTEEEPSNGNESED